MSSDENQFQHIYKYSRKTYKKCKRGPHQQNIAYSQEDTNNEGNMDISPRIAVKNDYLAGVPGCSCGLDTESELTDILHKKCPVITLAQQQLQRLLEETDKLLCDNTRCCRSTSNFLFCKEILVANNKCCCFLFILAVIAFVMGVLIGAASCGTHLRQFNSPLLACIDNLFIPETLENTYHSIV